MKPFLCLFIVLPAIWVSGPKTQAQPATPVILSGSNLPVIHLQAKGPVVSESKIPCMVRMDLPSNAERGSTVTGVVRIHGASSQGYPKKSYGISLDVPVPWLGMRASPHWVLN